MHRSLPVDVAEYLGPAVGGLVFIFLMGLVKEPARRNFNAVFVGGAMGAYISGGLGLWEFDLPDLSPAHRLDRLTAGVLMFTVRPDVRGRYQRMFADGQVEKIYLAWSTMWPDLAEPQRVSNRIVKRRGALQAAVEAGEPNAETLVEPVGDGRYRLTPRTGRTHQLRVHMAGLGVPIDNDPLYPEILEVDPGDFTHPLRLIAHRLEFDDPLTGERRCFVSSRA